MKTHSLILLLSSFLVLTSSCIDKKVNPTNEVVIRDIDIAGFNSINISLDANIYITQESSSSLKIETHENLFSQIETDVENNELRISASSNLKDVETMNIYIQVEDLFRIDLSGSGHLYTNECISSTVLRATLSGSGSINLCGDFQQLFATLTGSGDFHLNDIRTDHIQAQIEGSGNITASGEATNITYLLRGSGNIYSLDLLSTIATAHVMDSGNADLSVLNNFYAIISGSGNIRYTGSPVLIESITGTGSLIKLD